MSKHLFLAAIFCIVYGMSFGQETRPYPSDYDNVREQSVSLVNRWLVRMKKIAECPLYDLSLTLELFEENAKIYTSSTHSKKLRWYWPDAYFRKVNSLKCLFPPLYRTMGFDYNPVDPSMAEVSGVDGDYQVIIKVLQRFHGEYADRPGSYGDITVKEVHMHFRRDGNGVMIGKIAYILADPPIPYG